MIFNALVGCLLLHQAAAWSPGNGAYDGRRQLYSIHDPAVYDDVVRDSMVQQCSDIPGQIMSCECYETLEIAEGYASYFFNIQYDTKEECECRGCGRGENCGKFCRPGNSGCCASNYLYVSDENGVFESEESNDYCWDNSEDYFSPNGDLLAQCSVYTYDPETDPYTGKPLFPELAGAFGDPHVKTWSGEFFDYHGQCDLQLLHAPKFDGSQDMDIQIRTTIRYDYSYIESAALKIGDDVLEVGSWGYYALNGVEGALESDNVPTVGGYPVEYSQVDEKKHEFHIIMGENRIILATFKDWVNIRLFHGDEAAFGNVSGLMGSFEGKMVGRDGQTVFEDANEFGQEWQVQAGEEMLFQIARAPHAPEKCILPDAKTMAARRLGRSTIGKEAAEEACAHLKGYAFSACVGDVIASGDLDAAEIEAY